MGKSPVPRDKKSRTVLIVMSSVESKTIVLKSKKKTAITCDKILFKDSPIGKGGQNIYFDDHVPILISSLLYEARKLRSSNIVKSVWFNNGHVYIRRNDGAPAKRINSIAQLVNIEATENRKRNRSSSPKSDAEVDLVSVNRQHTNGKQLAKKVKESDAQAIRVTRGATKFIPAK